ncbi:MAG: hypothetical protein NTV38_01635, partial [Chloroflexi bacterium]|nr:hypothetical protein [Chloroflexota bacterium]
MLRAVASLPFLRELQRFGTPGHPDAPVACYLAACSLPGLDFHQQANDDFSGHTSQVLGSWQTGNKFTKEPGIAEFLTVSKA